MTVRLIAIACMFLLAAAGCGRRSSNTPADDGTMRIVSLAPALTQMAVDLGLTDAIVGVGQYDSAAPASARVVGTYTDINLEALAAAAPTHVMLQAGISGPPATLVEQSDAGRFKLIAYPYPNSIAAVADTLHRDSGQPQGVGAFLDRADAAAALRAKMLAQINEIRQITSQRPKPRVLMVIYAHPLTVSGGGTVLNEMLDVAGGINAAPQNATAPTLDREKLLGIDPDVVLLMLYDPTPLGPLDEDHRVASLRGPGLKAYARKRIYKIEDPQALLPTTTMPRVIAEMARRLHPDLAEAIDAALAAEPVSARNSLECGVDATALQSLISEASP